MPKIVCHNHIVIDACPAMQLAAEETEVTASQDDSSDVGDDDDNDGDADDDNDDDDDDDDDDEYDKEWMNEASDVSPLDSSNVLTTRQVTAVYVTMIIIFI